MRFKDSIKYNIPGTVLILMAAEKVYNKHGKEVVITSLMDGKHMKNSKHYIGEAVDLRTYFFSKNTVLAVAADLQKELGSNYDVLVEEDHIHIEYDPE